MIDSPEIAINTCIEVQHLNLYFGTNHVLKDIEISIPEQMVTALIGPSGCGKSTLLRTFNRMHDLTTNVRIEGKVQIHGQSIFDPLVKVNELRKKVGIVSTVLHSMIQQDESALKLVLSGKEAMINYWGKIVDFLPKYIHNLIEIFI